MAAIPPSSFPHDPVPSQAGTSGPVGDGELDFDSAAPASQPPMTRLERRQLNKEAHPPPKADIIPDQWGSEGLPAAPPPQGISARLERKAGNGTKPFTRFVTRPETTVAADLATERLPAERVSTINTQAFGKIRDQQEPEFRASRLQGVIDETWTHSRLTWLDNLGRLHTSLLALLITGVTSIFVWPYLKEVLRKRETAGLPVVSSALLPPDAVRQASIRKAFDAYLSASNLEEKLPWVIESERVEARMKDFYEVRLEKDPAIVSYEVSSPIRAGGEWWFTLECRLRDGTITSVVMKETPEGGQLDWENFTAYGSMSWERFHTARPTTPQSMRVRMRLVDTFTAKFPRGDYLAFEVSHRSGPTTLLAYAARNSRSGQWLQDEPGLNEWKPMNLYLRWEAAGADPPSLLIGDLIRTNWLDAVNAAPAAPVSAPTTPIITPSVSP